MQDLLSQVEYTEVQRLPAEVAEHILPLKLPEAAEATLTVVQVLPEGHILLAPATIHVATMAQEVTVEVLLPAITAVLAAIALTLHPGAAEAITEAHHPPEALLPAEVVEDAALVAEAVNK